MDGVVRSKGDGTGNGELVTIMKAIPNHILQVLAKTLPAIIQKGSTSGDVNSGALADSILASVNAKVENEFKNWFAKSLLPTFEKSTQVMFSQIQAALGEMISMSTKAMMDQVGASGKRKESYSGVASTLSNSDASKIFELLKEVKDQNSILLQQNSQLTAQVSALSRKVEEQSTFLSQMHVGGIPQSADSYSDLRTLIESSLYDPAFTKALQAKNPAALLWLCQNVSPSILKARPCVLAQNVLLSLIQQLSSILYECDDSMAVLLLSWLKEAMFRLVPKDPLISNKCEEILLEVSNALQIIQEGALASAVEDVQSIIRLHLSLL